MDKNHARARETSIRGLKSTLTTDPALSTNFIINELESDLKFVKPGTGTGSDSVHPDFIRNYVKRTIEWLITFMIDVLSSVRLPKLFKRAKGIAISIPGKDDSDPAHYRPISLLSAISPGHQAGLRKHRSYTEPVMAFTTHIKAGFQRWSSIHWPVRSI
jgi:hypothetical protein